MKTLISGTACAISALLLSSSVYAEPPAGVGAAEMEEGPCFSQTVVGPPGNFVPILDGVHGVLYMQIGTGKYVEANSASGTAKVTCHGRVGRGDVVQGFDVVTGLPAEGTAAGTNNACDALDTFGLLGACRGNNNGAIIIDAEFQGGSCGWGGRETLDWTSIRTPSGKAMLSCHFSD